MFKKILYRFTLWLDRLLSHMPSMGCFRPVKGTFSALGRLKEGSMEGEILFDHQESGPFKKGSITDLAGMHQHCHQPWPVFWCKSDDARLVGAMMHWRDSHDFICAEGVFLMPQRLRIREDRYLAQILVPKPVALEGAWTSLASNWGSGDNYYHWITDCLSRLYVREHLPEVTRILLPKTTPAYVWETLRMIGLADMATVAPAPSVKPERYYFCSPTSMTGVWDPLGFNWLRSKFDVFRSARPNGSPVFLTRKGKYRVPSNITQIENLFVNQGFEIVDCGELSVAEQIFVTSNAPAIAGLHGAGMTNILWAHPGTSVLELFPSGYLNACYEQMALQGTLNYQSILLCHDPDLHETAKWCDQWDNHRKSPIELS